MGALIEQTPTLQRKHIEDLSGVRCIDSATAQKLDYLLQSIRRDNDLKLVQTAMINRYATVIREVKDASGAIEKRVDKPDSLMDLALQKAILAGQYETIRLDLLNSIVGQSATLYTETTQTFTYNPGGKKVQQLVSDVRQEGGADASVVRWDAYACACKSALLYLGVAGGKLVETPIAPQYFRWAFAPTILEQRNTGGVTERTTLTDQLDEATCIGMELESTSRTKRWATWYGPSNWYPLGRYCIYEGQDWADVPDPRNRAAMQNALDYTVNGEMIRGATLDQMANPLSLWANLSGNPNIPTYPFAILYHDPLQDGLLPVSTSLYEICRELDLAASMILMAAVKGAKGARALKRDLTSKEIPDSDEGLLILGRGDDLINVGWSPTHAKAAQEVINEIARHTAEANHVAGWMVVADQTGEPPTGIALETMADDMSRFRDQRHRLNIPGQGRRFEIEKAMINAERGRASKARNGSEAIPPETKETWDPGRRVFPRDKAAVVDVWGKRIDRGEADLADMVQDMRRLKSREEAINFLDERAKEREKDPEKWARIDGLKPKAEQQGGFGGGTLAAQTKAGGFLKQRGKPDAGQQGKEQQPEEAKPGPAVVVR